MLVLSRKLNQKVVIREGDRLIATIMICHTNPNRDSIKLGFDLPSADIAVWRSEIDPERKRALADKPVESPPD